MNGQDAPTSAHTWDARSRAAFLGSVFGGILLPLPVQWLLHSLVGAAYASLVVSAFTLGGAIILGWVAQLRWARSGPRVDARRVLVSWALLTLVVAYAPSWLPVQFMYLMILLSGAAIVGALVPQAWRARLSGKTVLVAVTAVVLALATTLLLPLRDENSLILVYLLGYAVCVGLLAALTLHIARMPSRPARGDGEGVAPSHSE